MQVMIRCDAGAVIGGGHLVRCSALGAAFRRAGAKVAFAVSDETAITMPELSAEFPDVIDGMTTGEGDFHRFAAHWPSGVDLAIVDHYGLGYAFERHLAGWARKVLVIDDAPTRRHVCTHLVDTTLHRLAQEYDDHAQAGTVLMCGSEYAMLREPFRTGRAAALANNPTTIRCVLISMGLSDNSNATEAALKGLAAIDGLQRVDCVLGSAAPHIEMARALVTTHEGWHLHAGADGATMAALTAAADLVIGAPGSASYERCCLGRPALLVITADNQRSNAAALQATNAAVVVGELSRETPDCIAHAVRTLAGNPARLYAMHRAAASICDGNGADRVVRAVMAS